MNWWIVVDDHEGGASDGVVGAALVEAETEEAAAQEGMELLQDRRDEDGVEEPVERVFVAEFPNERGAYVVTRTVHRAPVELQCCAGFPPGEYAPPGLDGHLATCPEAPRCAACGHLRHRPELCHAVDDCECPGDG